MKRLFLLDAYALIYRAYYAFIRMPRYNTKGQNTSAIFGFVNTLYEVLQKEQPSHIAVVFDPKGGTFRHKMYPEYKANREKTPEDISFAIPYIKKIVEGFNIPVIEVPNYEADDVIGTLAKKGAREGFDVFMMTPDKDYGQLVEEHIKMYKPAKGGNEPEIMGVDEICAKHGIDTPAQVIDILALWGDASDNVPGCPGVGEKTATKLVSQYGSVEGLYEHTDELKGKQKEKVESSQEQVYLSKELVTIKVDVPVDFDEKALQLQPLNNEVLKELFEKLEFNNFISRILGETEREIPKKQEAGVQGSLFGDDVFAAPSVETIEAPSSKMSIEKVEHQYHLLDTDDKIKAFVEKALQQEEICFDTETTGLNPHEAELVGASFSFKAKEAYYIPFQANMVKDKERLQLLLPLFQNDKQLIIGQNLKYDISVLFKYGVDVKGPLFDTMLAHYLIRPGLRHNLDYLSEIYLNYTKVHTEELIGKKGKNQKSMLDVPVEKVAEYACEDADITYQLKAPLEKELQQYGVNDLFYKMEVPLLKVLAKMEHNGVTIDEKAIEEYAVELTQKITDLETQIVDMAGIEFNVSSPAQVGEVLFEHLKIEAKGNRTKAGKYSSSEEVLVKIKSKHPVIELILQHRKLKKLLSTYVLALPEMINPKTNKIHTSFNQAVTATGRLSSTNPNLQNIPIREEEGRRVRAMFVASADDRVLMAADYSQVELRLMAHMSQDKHMLEAFNRGVDIHTATAAKVFKVSEDEVTSDMRRKAKTANFGIIYGISAFGLAERLSISRSEAKSLIDGYFESYPQVKSYMDASVQKAREQGYVETLQGRKRYLPDINSRNNIVKGNAERNAINAPIQGSAADIIKLAMVKIQNRIEQENLQSLMILQVHDELVFDVLKTELEQLKAIVKEEMEHVVELSLPLSVDVGVGNTWLEAH